MFLYQKSNECAKRTSEISDVRKYLSLDLSMTGHDWSIILYLCIRYNYQPVIKIQTVVYLESKNSLRISEFYIGQHDMPGYNTFSCYIEGQQYFLCAENNEVFLMVSNNTSSVEWLNEIQS